MRQRESSILLTVICFSDLVFLFQKGFQTSLSPRPYPSPPTYPCHSLLGLTQESCWTTGCLHTSHKVQWHSADIMDGFFQAQRTLRIMRHWLWRVSTRWSHNKMIWRWSLWIYTATVYISTATIARTSYSRAGP